MIGCGKTDVGLIRQNNEDAIYVSDKPVGVLPNLYIVSDGMGGHNAGEIASGRSIGFFCGYVENAGRQSGQGDILDILVEGVTAANKTVYELSLSSGALSGMGATFSACVVAGGKLYAAHVGDSRVYIARPGQNGRPGELTQVSSDHTFVNEMVKAGEITKEQAKTHPRRNIITRALGIDAAVNVDGIVADVYAGDFLLICSDGLSNMVPDEALLRLALSEPSVEEKCGKLIELAKQNGGEDNISVVLAWVNEVTS